MIYLLPNGHLSSTSVEKCDDTWSTMGEKWSLPNHFSTTRTLEIEGQRYEICPEAVALHSSYFSSMFSRFFQEKEKQNIPVEIPHPEHFPELLPYLHSGLIDFRLVTVDNCFKLVRLADYLGLDKLNNYLQRVVLANHQLLSSCPDFCSMNIPLHFMQSLMSFCDHHFEDQKKKLQFLFKWSMDFKDSGASLAGIETMVKMVLQEEKNKRSEKNSVLRPWNIQTLVNLKLLNKELFQALDCLDLLSLWEAENGNLKRSLEVMEGSNSINSITQSVLQDPFTSLEQPTPQQNGNLPTSREQPSSQLSTRNTRRSILRLNPYNSGPSLFGWGQTQLWNLVTAAVTAMESTRRSMHHSNLLKKKMMCRMLRCHINSARWPPRPLGPWRWPWGGNHSMIAIFSAQFGSNCGLYMAMCCYSCFHHIVIVVEEVQSYDSRRSRVEFPSSLL